MFKNLPNLLNVNQDKPKLQKDLQIFDVTRQNTTILSPAKLFYTISNNILFESLKVKVQNRVSVSETCEKCGSPSRFDGKPQGLHCEDR